MNFATITDKRWKIWLKLQLRLRLGWFNVPKYFKNFWNVVFPIALATKTSLSENHEKILTSRPRPSRQKFYNIAIVLWILMFANFSSQIYKFWAWKLQSIYGKPIGLWKKLAKEFLKISEKCAFYSRWHIPAWRQNFITPRARIFKIFQKFFCRLFS